MNGSTTIASVFHEFEQRLFEISCGVENVAAIHDCMENSPTKPESFFDALWFTYIGLRNMVDDFQKFLDQTDLSA